MAVSRVDNHPWSNMNEEEILRSTGLILADPDTGQEGITLAAILLFGKDQTIMSVLPQYKTDAIYRVKNMDRYDDREVIITNLIDSYRRLMDFGKRFKLIQFQFTMSVRQIAVFSKNSVTFNHKLCSVGIGIISRTW